MRKNEKGVLSIEASLVLCVFTLFVLFLFNFATVYRAENMVSHATLQTADAVALESYLRETSFETDEQGVLFWANRINGVTDISEDSFESLRTANLQTIIKDKFTLAIGDNASSANATLQNLCVKDGLSGVDFSKSYVDLTKNDVIVNAEYTVKLRFPVFGATELHISKAAKAKTAGEILFGLSVIPQQEIMGSTQGSGKYRMGTKVEISAEANYGYDFVSWNDGNTENPRTVTIMGAQTYVAQFERHSFGVNLFLGDVSTPGDKVRGSNAYGKVVAISGGESKVGGSEYSYEGTVTVKAEVNPGYKFLYWKGSKISDAGMETIQSNEPQFDIFIDGVYDLTAVCEPYTYNVRVETDCDAARASLGVRRKGTSSYQTGITVKYGNILQIKASKPDGYTFLGWYKDGRKVSNELNFEAPVPVNGGTYEAKYEKDPIIYVKANGQGTVKILANGKTSYCCKRGSSVEVQASPKSGYYFAGWSDGGSARHRVTVNADMTLTATFKKLYSVTVSAGAGGSASGGGSNIRENERITITATPSGGYRFLRWEKSVDGGRNYTNVSSSSSLTVTVNGNAHYRACFESVTYTVTLNANGGLVKGNGSLSYNVNYGGSSAGLPRPVRQGYRFGGWEYNGRTYNEGSQVTGITGNVTLVAKWSQCNGHVWGRCGVTHTGTRAAYLSGHSRSHKTQYYQCKLCVECGAFASGSCRWGCINNNLNYTKVGAVHLCYQANGCANLWNRSYPLVRNVHEEIGYP